MRWCICRASATLAAMDARIVKLIAAVLKKADAEHHADAVLRRELKTATGLSRVSARLISRTIFAYYRWQGWLNAAAPLATQLDEAMRLNEEFALNPTEFSDIELAERAVPAWAREHMELPPAWVRTIQSEPRLWLRAKKGQGRDLAERLGECWVSDDPLLADAVEYQGGEDLFRTPEFHAGDFELQDLGSQIVGLLCAPQPGQTWWDACAGEGGKTLHLSDLMQNKGLLWASDRAEWRLKKLKQRAGRAKCFNYRAALWDGSAKLPTRTKFDGVLVDAPCSGIGTWQRNPHARWTTTANDVMELSAIQSDLLQHAATALKPGGKLIYAVCTLSRLETEAVANQFTQSVTGFAPLPLSHSLGKQGVAENQLWLWPQDTGGNGMFVAAWQKQS